ncbi:MAG: protein-tyrosine-phosphatase [Muricauda sp.]|jgi:arsenate reductase|nr:protein-tyrosine-phosphatase [Allomuricauda sp.]MBO6532893.1 protein-tyrosine-phosphatase [Allomuricauda sp.]MBO6589153.1 protein-tyrosine-phosphatase [Allomuricauda sp.]MBO6618778.1 protein-tyrosine-phosphatase [Allomuricauda sp.]MBO6644691.1 protein-tyrosine-phosphatase [Allomuricauda sp.]MBO6746591.1 protein-tyrosine-phosphatase [Allomuricauda sp.]
MALNKALHDFVSQLETDAIPQERKQLLDLLSGYIQEKVDKKESVRLNFICTHNSRRSHLSQVWAQTLAHHFGVRNLSCYSGGTEATALFPMVATTLANTGFEVQMLSEGKNPVYAIKFAENEHPVICFSKTMDDAFNPTSDFAAIMTCSQADEGCPFVPGAEKRIPITYDDPKAFDNTPQQAEKYSERSKQIATEMCYIFSKIKKPV